MTPDEQRARDVAKAIDVHDSLEKELAEKHGGLVAALLRRARDEADEAMQALCDVDCTDAEAVRQLQNHVHRHRDLVKWMREIIGEGRAAWAVLDDQERADLEQLLGIRGDD